MRCVYVLQCTVHCPPCVRVHVVISIPCYHCAVCVCASMYSTLSSMCTLLSPCGPSSQSFSPQRLSIALVLQATNAGVRTGNEASVCKPCMMSSMCTCCDPPVV